MSTTLFCPKCETLVTVENASGPLACAQCGAELSVPATATAASIPPPPTSSLPPPPPRAAIAANSEEKIAYGALQQATIYLGMARALRGIGIGNIIWGAVLLVVGVLASAALFGIAGNGDAESVISLVVLIIFVAFGLAFIVEGIWLIAAPSSAGLLVAGIMMFVTAALFIRVLLVALILIFYGVALIKRYKKYGTAMSQRPTPDIISQAKGLLDKAQKAIRKKSPDLIEFSSSDAFARRLWRGLLQENLIILIGFEARIFSRTIADVFFLPPSEFAIETTRKEFIGKWQKGVLYIRGQKYNGTIPPECYDRYQAWMQQYLLPRIASAAQEIV